MERIAVIGPGAVGGTVAAGLSRTGHDVLLCARTPVPRLSVTLNGQTVAAAPPVITDPADASPARWVLIATKAYSVDATARWLDRLIGPDTRVAVLQNGVEHAERFAPFVDTSRLVPVMVNVPAERGSPGIIRQERPGRLIVPDTANGVEFTALFAETPITAETTDDFTTMLWRKLAANAAGAVSAVVDQPNRVVRHPAAARTMRALAAECITVGSAEGATIDDGYADELLDFYRGSDPEGVNSLLADRRAGRPMEWDARNGAVGRIGKRHGVATPVNDAVTDLLSLLDVRNMETFDPHNSTL